MNWPNGSKGMIDRRFTRLCELDGISKNAKSMKGVVQFLDDMECEDMMMIKCTI